MNIQNIVALAAKLKALGFDEMDSLLLKRICFKPENFSISSKIIKEQDQVGFDIYLERCKNDGNYVLKFYDAFLLKETPLARAEIVGVELAELEHKMQNINWSAAFDINERKQFDADDKLTWADEVKIESIVNELETLEMSEDGKAISNQLKSKYWSNIPEAALFTSFNTSKSKQQINQRFYVSEGQPGISVDEAYRFLQNKWLEKQLQANKREASETDEIKNESQASGGNGLLKKKRLSKSRGTKRSNVMTS